MDDSLVGATRSAHGDRQRLGRIFDALGHPYRRRILFLVSDYSDRDADHVALEDVSVDVGGSDLLLTDLHHRHLPPLAEADYVTWDRQARTVSRGPNFEEVEPLVGLVDEHREELPAGWP